MALTKVITGVTDLNQAQSTNGLKFPTGSVFAGTPEQGMIRNDQSQSSETSSSTMQFYNGTAWKNFVNIAPIPLGSDNFNSLLYTGNSTNDFGTSLAQSVTGVGFQPDLVWLKSRNQAYSHMIFDSVRGATKAINTNTNVGVATSNGFLKSFDSDGFGLGGDFSVNRSGYPFISWNWKAGGAPTATNSGGQTPTSGSKMVDGVASTANFATSTSYPLKQSVNSSAGFSITTITKSAINIPLEVPHGLSSPPELIMLKTTSTSDDWNQWQTAIGTGAYLSTNRNGGNDGATASSGYGFTVVNNDIIRNQWTNAIQTWVCYAWHSVAGYSKMGSYVGNGSNTGTVVDTGFEPAWVMIKSASSNDNGGGAWLMYDNKRSTSNPRNKRLYANYNSVEQTNSNYDLDFLTASTKGFQPKNGASGGWGFNTVNVEYIYMAFAT